MHNPETQGAHDKEGKQTQQKKHNTKKLKDE